MSIDEQVANDLIQTLDDGEEGFAKVAEKLTDSDSPELVSTFEGFSRQRATFGAELRSIAATYGDKIPETGSVAGALHRGWLSLRDALSGSDAKGVLAAAEQGEDHAVKAYDKAMASDISVGLRTVVERQQVEVRAAHDTVRALCSAHSDR